MVGARFCNCLNWGTLSKEWMCPLAFVLVAAIAGNGCAGTVMGSSSPGGTNVPSAGTPQAQLSATPTNVTFPATTVGASASQTITLRNAGTGSVTISSVAVTGAGFNVSGIAANTTLAPGQTAALDVTFAPAASNSVAGSVTITSSAGGLAIALSGNGAQLSSHSVVLNWDPSTSAVIGYYVYRAMANGTYAKINSAPVVLTDYTDANIQSGQTYMYVITAVDADTVESAYSEPVLAVIP